MSSKSPQLFIVAGPNGAGKSTISTSLLKNHHLQAFDWDKEFYHKWSVFGYDPLVEAGVRNTTNEYFESLRNEAIQNSTSFAFETNFHTNAILKVNKEFKDAGFETNLYFLLISDVNICKQRVAYRVAEEHGHDVSPATIEERFIKGLSLLNINFSRFNRTFVFDASLDHQAELIATFKDGVLKDKYEALPASLSSKLNKIHDVLKKSD